MQQFYTIANFLFGFRGRINRLQYLIVGVLLPITILYFRVYRILFPLGFAAGPLPASFCDSEALCVAYFWGVPAISIILFEWLVFAAAVKRLQDIGWNGSWAMPLTLWFVIPIVTVVLLLIPGAKEANTYGVIPSRSPWPDSEVKAGSATEGE